MTLTRPRTAGIRPTPARARYGIGIDLGTSHTVAVTHRLGGGGPAPETALLETWGAAAPSVLFIGGDDILFGQAAVDAGLVDPTRVIRGFRRRIGDPTPVLVDGVPWKPEDLAARMLRWTVDRVAPRLGSRPDHVAVTHPVGWGAHATGLLRLAAARQGLDVVLIGEPQAAVHQLVVGRRLAPGSTVAVYDLGGSTLDAAVVRTADDAAAHEVLGSPECVDGVGGADLDDAVFDHVRAALPDTFASFDETDPGHLAAVARIRHACIRAKEQLSSDTETSISVALAGHLNTVRLHRSEFETLIRPLVEQSVAALGRAIASAGLESRDLADLLLVGGSSRIPLVAQLVSEGLDRPVAVDADPRSAVARGAVLSAVPVGRPEADGTTIGIPSARRTRVEPEGGDAPELPTRPEKDWVVPQVAETVDPQRLSVAALVAGGAATAVVAIGAILLCFVIAFPTPPPGFGLDRSTAQPEPTRPVQAGAGPGRADAAPRRTSPSGQNRVASAAPLPVATPGSSTPPPPPAVEVVPSTEAEPTGRSEPPAPTTVDPRPTTVAPPPPTEPGPTSAPPTTVGNEPQPSAVVTPPPAP